MTFCFNLSKFISINNQCYTKGLITLALENLLKQTAITLADNFFALLPSKLLSKEQLKQVLFVAHRGFHNNTDKLENTFPAFDACLNKNIFAIEMDIRWTKDLVPIIIHDPDCRRVFNRPDLVPSKMTYEEFKKELPQVPSLKELLARYKDKFHFMIEIKADPTFKNKNTEDTIEQFNLLNNELQSLTSGVDYHFISLKPELFEFIKFAPTSSMLTIAELDLQSHVDLAVSKKYGGVTSHYLVMTQHQRNYLKNKNIPVGTGFIDSKNNFIRQVNLGSQWIFTNIAPDLSDYREQLLKP